MCLIFPSSLGPGRAEDNIVRLMPTHPLAPLGCQVETQLALLAPPGLLNTSAAEEHSRCNAGHRGGEEVLLKTALYRVTSGVEPPPAARTRLEPSREQSLERLSCNMALGWSRRGSLQYQDWPRSLVHPVHVHDDIDTGHKDFSRDEHDDWKSR